MKYQPTHFSPRYWQGGDEQFQDSLIRAFEDGSSSFALMAWPGAGKTKAAVMAIHDAKMRGIAKKAIWVVPGNTLRCDLGNEKKGDLIKSNLTVTSDVTNRTIEDNINFGVATWPGETDVWIVTYAQVHSNPRLFSALCKTFKVLLIADEIHHVRERGKWGPSMREAFEGCSFKIVMSGTLFTTTGCDIPFVRSVTKLNDGGKEERFYKPDFEFPMSRALNCEPGEKTPSIRQLTYVKVNADGEFTYRNVENDKQFKTIHSLEKDGKDAKLTPHLSPEGEMVRVMLEEGIKSLDTFGDEGGVTPGGLVVCMNGDHAREVGRVLKEEFNQPNVEVVLHDTPKASEVIDDFRVSGRWLVTVRMVSEGVDIPRLRVGVYLTNYITYLFLIQWLGRLWRWDARLGVDQSGVAVLPAHQQIMEWVAKLEETTMQAEIANVGDDAGGDGNGGGVGSLLDKIEEKTSAQADGGFAFGMTFHQDVREQAEQLDLGTLSPSHPAVIATLEAVRRKQSVAPSPEPTQAEKDANIRRDRERTIRKKTAACIAALKKYPPDDWNGENPYEYVNGKANKIQGVSRWTEKGVGIDRLKQRCDALDTLFGILKGGAK